MGQVSRPLVVLACAALALTLGGPPTSAAAPAVGCGSVITESTTLRHDVGPCTDSGITLAGDGITLDLNGHRVFAGPSSGDGAGVLLRQVRGATVRNGTVSGFDGGVVIEGGGRSTVTRMLARENIGESRGHPGIPGSAALYGDGILIEASTGNRVTANVVENNGPFSGIGLIEMPDEDHPFPPGPTSGNLVARNVVRDNTACRADGFCDNDGIRIEPAVGPGNVVLGNVVRGNGLDGISLFADADANTVARNVVEANGFAGAVSGDGIRVFGSRNLVERNSSTSNSRDGISVGRRSIAPPGPLPPNQSTGNPRGMHNRILGNAAASNGTWDLYDSNPACDRNSWRRNAFQTAEPGCTKR